MRKILGRLIEILLAYILVFYVLYYLQISISSQFWLFISVGLWLTIGHAIKRKLKYQGILASWYAPLSRVNERGLGYAFFALTFISIFYSKNLYQKEIIFTVLIATITLLIIHLLIKSKTPKPLFKSIILFSSIEAYIITEQLLYLLQRGFSFDNLIYQAILLIVLIYVISQSNYYFLRNFMFYQKLIVSSENNLSYKQKLNIAVHEASHLLMYIFFKEVPYDIQILLFDEAKAISPDAQGMVIAQIPMYNTKEFLEWRMMLAISGIRGELLIFNNHSHGSESDFQQWRSLAHIYLMNFKPTYTPQPITVNQMNHNKTLETKLYNRQIFVIDKYLKSNKGILLKISKQALVYNKLSYLQIYPHFSNVKRIKEMPYEYRQ